MKKIFFLAVAVLALSSGAPTARNDAAFEVLRQTVFGAYCGPDSPLMGGALLQGMIEASSAFAQEAPQSDAPPALMTRLGDAHLPITTSSPLAQQYFDQGVRLMHGFNHAEALRAFRYAQQLDSNCAMCFWGEAMALGPNINARMRADDNQATMAAMMEAGERAGAASEIERGLIEALQGRFVDPAPENRGELDNAFADRMAALADRFPDNDFVNVYAAEAVMTSQPWNYWEEDGVTPRLRAGEAIARVERVLNRSPNDAGAIHLYIHLTEASRNPWLAEAAASRLDRARLLTGHLQHMPGHTYARIGRFRDSVRSNIAAVNADASYLAANPGAAARYRYGYYPHNVHFVLAGAAMGGDGRTALRYADRLDAVLPYTASERGVFSIYVKAAPWFARARFAQTAQILAAESPGEEYPYIIGAWRYARAWAHIRNGDAAAARAELTLYNEHRAAAAESETNRLGRGGIFLLNVHSYALLGRILMLEGDHAGAIRELREAVRLEDESGYSEPPMIYYPIGRVLGAAYLRNNQPGLAEQQFLQTLLDSPNDAYAYWGLAEARRMRGDRAGANAAMRMHRAAYMGTRRITLADL